MRCSVGTRPLLSPSPLTGVRDLVFLLLQGVGEVAPPSHHLSLSGGLADLQDNSFVLMSGMRGGEGLSRLLRSFTGVCPLRRRGWGGALCTEVGPGKSSPL